MTAADDLEVERADQQPGPASGLHRAWGSLAFTRRDVAEQTSR
jgi:hypothetical protein